ncbi:MULTISPECIES: cytochrome b5 domain-containing protein [Kocuria]|uniref:Cytochrome b5 heme-binding domain-containing protein n=1 Tax=Kocuria subflava TaxID=1736139 RepID=A0A846TN90_9MICC|nr:MULTISPECIES: cytochrome b5-like heme/steroid binding domain-containing protein [Kocuria]NKE10678.1 hypothetical protein [Kocuria subflava]
MIVIVVVAAIAVVGTLAAIAFALLNPPSPNVGDAGKLEITFSSEEQRKIKEVTVTPQELEAATCDDGADCWIAVNGVVYDMSVFPDWARGRHHGIKAGTDATEKFVGSGHGRDILERMPVVGRLEQ